jgi:hypothetical protein
MRIALRLLIGFVLVSFVACGGSVATDPTTDTVSSNDTGEADSSNEADEGGVDDQGSPEPDEGQPLPDVPVTPDEGPEPVTLACEDLASIDVAAIQANPVLRLHKLGLGGWDLTENMVCDATSAGDVDSDPTTTFPGEGDVTDQSTFAPCTAGLNNALIALQDLGAGFGLDIRQQMLDNTANGSINASVELVDNGDGNWTLNFYQAEVAGDNVYDEENGTWSSCDITDAASSPCDFEIDPVSFNEACEPLVSMDASLADGVVTAGGPDEVFTLALPVEGVGTIELAISSVNVTANLDMVDGQVSGISGGLLTGILPKDGILALVNNLLPPDVGIPPELIISLLEGIFDIDSDGDGLNDALSVGLMFEATPISVLGMQAAE